METKQKPKRKSKRTLALSAGKIRRAGEKPTVSSNVRVVYSRDFPAIEGTYTCIKCFAGYRGDRCPRCFRPSA